MEFIRGNLAVDFDVVTVEDGAAALKVIESESIDLIISDIMMPGMDGLELCRIVKSDPAFSHIPFILLSAKTDTAVKIEGLEYGADVYIEKPFSIKHLRAQANSILENRNRMRENFRNSPLQYFKSDGIDTSQSGFIDRLNALVLENMNEKDFSIDSLAEQFMMSRSNFHKKIKAVTGLTPNDYIKLIRLNKAAELLSTGKYKINEVGYMVGFNTPSYFSRCFHEQFGKLPKDFIEER